MYCQDPGDLEFHFILDAFREEEPGVSRKADPGFCILVLKDAVVKARDVAQSVECSSVGRGRLSW